MSEAVLRLSGVEKIYNRGQTSEVRVLNGVDLTLARGEMVALVAPSGAGKSTLLHIAGLLDTPDAGRVEIGGEDMTGLNDRRRTMVRRQEVGFVYQFHHLLPEFSALENIVLPQLANGVARREAETRAQALSGRAPRTGPRPCQGASNSAWPFAGRWPMPPAFSWQTSRRAISIPAPRIRSLPRSRGWCAAPASRR